MNDPVEAGTANAVVDINNPEFNAEGKNEVMSIKDATQALEIAQTLQRDDQKRDYMRARVLAAFNGEAPYSEAELQNAAQSYRFNVSFGFMEGVVGRAVVPYNDLTNDNQYVANIKGELPEDRLNIIRNTLTETIDKWGEWQKLTSNEIQDLVLNGFNNFLWPSDHDPFPVFIPQKFGWVHEMTPNGVKDLDVFVWKKSYMMHELYRKIADEPSAKKAGWNIENCRAALEAAVPQDLRSQKFQGGYVKIEEALRGGTLYTSMVGGKKVECFHVLAAEIDGSVTHYIVWDDTSANSTKQNVELFKRERRWKSFEEVLVYFDVEPGDALWHGSRGLGRRSFNTHRSLDKLRCSILDQAFVSGLSLMQPTDQSSQEDFTFVVAGPFAVIPPGINVQTTTIPALAQTTFQADALLSATSEQRIGDIVPQTNNPLTNNDKTATQAKIEASRSQAISKSNLQRYLDPLSQTVSIIVRRLLIPTSQDPYAKEFQAKLIEKGITREEMEKIRGAKSTGRIAQVTGDDANAMQVVYAEFRGDPDVPQKDLKRRRISSLLGPKDAEDLVPDMEDQTNKLEAEREQKSEIGTLLNGIPLQVSPRDIHEFHLPIALNWAEGQIQSIMQTGQGAEPEQIQADLAHAGEHLGYLSKDKSKADLVKQFSAQLKQSSQALQHIAQIKAKAQAAAHAHAATGVNPSQPPQPAPVGVSQPPNTQPQ